MNNCNCLPDLFNELVLRQGGLQGFYLVALTSKDVSSGLVDIFQQQDLNVLGIEGLQDFGNAFTRLQSGAKAGGRRLEGGSGRRRKILGAD